MEGEDGDLQRDEVVLVEVQVEALDHAWWRDYRHALERRFGQDQIPVRALPAESL